EVVEPKVWTTPSDSDACTEYARRFAPEHRLFEAKQQCEAWVKERRCRPGRICSDGCNTLSCDGNGMKTIATMAECSVYLGEGLEYRAKSTRPIQPPDWERIMRAIASAFRAPTRRLKITGYALPDEAPSKPLAQRLARTRAEATRKQLAT